VDSEGPPSVDLLEALRAALDELEPRLVGRTVDIEMARLRVLGGPTLVRETLAELIGSALASIQPADGITVRVARTAKAARIDVISEVGDGAVICSTTLPLAPGGTSATDA
jgi:signal transduction histidine kinase